MTMTAQEIYEKVRAGLKAQGCQALEQGRCWYRTPDGLRCAVGMLIPDEVYAANPNIETWGTRIVRDRLGLTVDWRFLDALQDAHDAGGTFLSIDSILVRIDDVARDWGLTLVNDG